MCCWDWVKKGGYLISYNAIHMYVSREEVVAD